MIGKASDNRWNATEALIKEFGGWPERPLRASNKDGSNDMRLRFWRFHARLEQIYARYKEERAHQAIFHEEIHRPEKYPMALRPAHVFREDGGHMTWDKWLKSPTLDMSGIVFDDGISAGFVPHHLIRGKSTIKPTA